VQIFSTPPRTLGCAKIFCKDRGRRFVTAVRENPKTPRQKF